MRLFERNSSLSEEEQEKINFAACFNEAMENGFTLAQAENCENGEMKCILCPFTVEKGSWATFTRRTNPPKLNFIMKQLQVAKIPHRVNGDSFHAPILEVCSSRLEDANKILLPIDLLPDDHISFKLILEREFRE
tara:strand:+ start:413 stop:817 length:405 start_codon:yes stop_codon:yes gene_type:complete